MIITEAQLRRIIGEELLEEGVRRREDQRRALVDDKLTVEVASIAEGKRTPREPGQSAKSDMHSDLYTDENPRGTIKGLKFATVTDAEASVRKIRSSGKTHAHKIQAAVAMEQRARVAGKASAADVYRRFINSMKKK